MEKETRRGTPPAQHAHISYLDGLRALAAILVVLSHCDVWTCRATMQHGWWLEPLEFVGNLCVPAFIVLSGYLLASPLVRTGMIPGGTEAYLRRRGRRILPAYWFALAFSAFIAIRVTHDTEIYALATHSFVASVFLLHDLIPPAPDFNAPLWSVAVEWHIYFTLPVLTWAWRRWGALRSICGAACLAFLAINLSERLGRPNLVFQYYGMFYAGCAAAWIAQASGARAELYRRLPWRTISAGLVAVFACLCAGDGIPEFGQHVEYFSLIWAAILAAGLVALADPAPSRVRTFLTWPPLVRAAGFSYSLYLLHWPVLAIISDLLLSPKMSFALHFWLMVILGLPASCGLAYLSSLVFERPFLAASRRASLPGANTSRRQATGASKEDVSKTALPQTDAPALVAAE
jgi:peptidoglycan/LPS O-acetylase OafA/YrhL